MEFSGVRKSQSHFNLNQLIKKIDLKNQELTVSGMEKLHPTEIRVLEVVRDGKDWRAMRHARKALLEVFPDGFAVVDDDDLVGKILHDVETHSWLPWPNRVGERAKVQTLFAKEAERRARKKKEQERELQVSLKIEDCWADLKAQGFSVPDYGSFSILYRLSVIEVKVRPEFYDCDREEMVWFNPTE